MQIKVKFIVIIIYFIQVKATYVLWPTRSLFVHNQTTLKKTSQTQKEYGFLY